jgi:hypothetical protein
LRACGSQFEAASPVKGMILSDHGAIPTHNSDRARRLRKMRRRKGSSGPHSDRPQIMKPALEWITNTTLSAGKGATFQEFTASAGRHQLSIGVAPWGEGHLRLDEKEIAHVTGAASRYEAFACLRKVAAQFLQEHPLDGAPHGTEFEPPSPKRPT